MNRIVAITRKSLDLGVFGYCILLLVLFLTQRCAIYYPLNTVPDPAKAGVPDMSVHRVVTADGLKLLAWWKPPANETQPAIVFFHGNAGHLGHHSRPARFFLDAGFGVLLVSWRYNAGAGGSPSEEGLLIDGRAALDFVAARGIDRNRIVLYGESLGTGVAVAMASERDVAALVLKSAYSSIADVAQDRFWFTPARWLVRDKFDSVSRIADVQAPILILHGERDRTIPVRFARRLFDAAPEPKEAHFFPDGSHKNLYRLGAGQLVLGFLDRHIADSGKTFDGKATGS